MPHGESRRSVAPTLIYPPQRAPIRIPRTSTLLAMTVVGPLVAFPTLLMWRDRQRERESILWVAFMSVYANVVGHFSCSEATEPTKKADEANGTVLQSLQRCPNRLSQLVSAARTVDRRGARLPSRRGRGWATRVAATTQMSSRAPLGASSPSTRSHSCCAVPEKPSTTRHSCATPSRPARSSGSISPSVYSKK